MAAFPQLDVIEPSGDQKYNLVPALYTKIPAVHDTQRFIEGRIKDAFKDQILIPEWVAHLKEDFDVLKFPELAIATPCFYTLPFFLTWQRRHLWGVLPYATHSRLGVLVRRDHPELDALRKIEGEYERSRERDMAYGLWVQDPSLARWIPLLLNAATVKPDAAKQQHVPAVFAVGAYLHQELLPLACAVLGRTEIAALLADSVHRLEPSEVRSMLPPEVSDTLLVEDQPQHKLTVTATDKARKGNGAWAKESALIVDLALLNSPPAASNWTLLRLPHCVYVPIGIGYSVLAWPLLARTPEARKWTAQLLAYSAGMLLQSKPVLSEIGIEVDERLWQHISEA